MGGLDPSPHGCFCVPKIWQLSPWSQRSERDRETETGRYGQADAICLRPEAYTITSATFRSLEESH